MSDLRITAAERDAFLRTDFVSFVQRAFLHLVPGQVYVPDWYIEAIAYRLMQVMRGEVRKLIINLPPRTLKSIITSVAFPAFVLGHDPRKKFVCASYGSDLAINLAAQCRSLVGAPWYRRVFPHTKIGSKDTQAEFSLTQTGFRMTTSVGGTVTGRGGNIIIIDDPIKAQDALSEQKRSAAIEWFRGSILSRFDNKKDGAIIVVMQRVHMDDLTGYLLREGGGNWTVLSLPAIATKDEEIPLMYGAVHRRAVDDLLSPARLPRHVLEQEKLDIGTDNFQSQYQQEPVPPGGNMINPAWIQRYEALPSGHEQWFVLQSWDVAAREGSSNDWSVCTTWLRPPDKRHYLIHCFRGRLGYPALLAKIEELAKQFNARQVLVEKSPIAEGILQMLKFKVSGLTEVKPVGDKIQRLAMASPKFNAEQVFFPVRAPWLTDLEAELFAFPGSRFDDQVDSVSQALLFSRGSIEVWQRLAIQFEQGGS